ncbi:hypothetical protein AVEN_169939-1 [Araneus ventricosus]|uniref:Uncharacterized protein n=1 Tax=Araneus ventricosus TaxID=182803 RepID=A0A4Y2T2P7_ARAVE|nr:hypothetical protein AVEN_122853-1 [Araneus ventricosus]GBN93540.1 hypothetical protein AVEN_200902-1 [Araneus ventricosus]GBN94859.1 hypothetical protein AVEN_205569-1 [Araneus ventricosus]GBN94888.1 hypothetical protein AVEN_169939-1 [Araneus ventricosus]
MGEVPDPPTQATCDEGFVLRTNTLPFRKDVLVAVSLRLASQIFRSVSSGLFSLGKTEKHELRLRDAHRLTRRPRQNKQYSPYNPKASGEPLVDALFLKMEKKIKKKNEGQRNFPRMLKRATTIYPTHDCQPTLLGVRHHKGSRGERTSPTRKRNPGHPAPKTAFIKLRNVVCIRLLCFI